MRVPGRLFNAAARYRAVETTVVGVLVMLVCATVVLAPLLQRAILQSVLNTAVAERTARATGLVLVALPPAGGTHPLVEPAALDRTVPADARPLFGRPVESVSIDIAVAPIRRSSPTGRVVWREGMCDHLRFTAGRCPTEPGEVAVSAAESARRGWTVGERIGVGEQVRGSGDQTPGGLRATLAVVGVYAQLPGRYWFGDELSSNAGASTDPVVDALIADRSTVTGAGTDPETGARRPWQAPTSEVDLPVRSAQITPSELERAASTLRGYLSAGITPGGASAGGSSDAQTPTAPTGPGPVVSASSGLTDLAEDIRIQQSQTRSAVPLLLAQLVAVLLVVLWLVLVALTEQRRPELALTRLRGRSPRDARRVLLAESLPTVAAGALAGAVLAVVVSSVARRLWLDHAPGWSVSWLDAVCLLGAALACFGLLAASVLRPSRQSVAALLRTVPARTSGVVLGTVEGMLVAVGVATYVALLTGQVSGPLALAVPAALAAALGIAGARLVTPAMAAAGRRAAARGAVAPAVGSTEAARRPTARWLVPLTALATASVVFGATAFAIGAHNQAIAGRVDTGAPTVAVTDAGDARALRAAVTRARSAGVDATPVVQLASADPSAPTTVAVVPDEFRRVASLRPADRDEALWSRLAGNGIPPVEVTGRSLTGRARVLGSSATSPAATYRLALRLLSSDGSRNDVDVVTLALHSGTTAGISAYLPCGDGCRVLGLVISPSDTDDGARVTITVDDLRVDGRPFALGTTGGWRSEAPEPASAALDVGTGAFRLDVGDAGLAELVLASAATADDPPALATPGVPGGGTTLAGTGVDGEPQAMQEAGTLTTVPGAPPASVVANLDVLLGTNSRIGGNGRALVYLAHDDAGGLDRLRTALRASGITVTEVHRAAVLTRDYERSAAAWTLRLALWTAVTALLVALLGLVVLVASSWRGRSRDLASLRMTGLTGRQVRGAALWELVPLAVVGVVVGSLAGLVGGSSAMSTLPLFTRPPTTAIIDLSPAWGATVVAAGGSLVVLVAGAVVMALWTVRRSALSRLRDPA